MKFVALKEMFLYHIEEGSADFALHILAVWGVIPHYASLPATFRSCG